MRIIDLEAHFQPEVYEKYIRSRRTLPTMEDGPEFVKTQFQTNLTALHPNVLEKKLSDFEEMRLPLMDQAGIDLQALSICLPGPESLEDTPREAMDLARAVNDSIADITAKYPGRFFGMTTIAPQLPEESAAEIERAVTKLGFKGVNINGRAGETYLDDKKFRPIFAMAEQLDVPVYLHPVPPGRAMLEAFVKDYGFALAGTPWGFGVETAHHAMRLIFSGLFDEHPNLKIVLGHLGEGLPFLLYRMDVYHLLKGRVPKDYLPAIEKRPSDYFKHNFYVTISANTYLPAFLCAHLALGADRILFACDYPYDNFETHVSFIRNAPIADLDKEKIFHLNAERLYRL